jgi:hypothetical protein
LQSPQVVVVAAHIRHETSTSASSAYTYISLRTPFTGHKKPLLCTLEIMLYMRLGRGEYARTGRV